MKSILVLVSALAFAGNTLANPIIHAECSAVFKATAITMAKESPDMSAIARRFSDRFKYRADAEIGSATATHFYVKKMDEMTANLRAGAGTGISKDELKYCLDLAKSYGM